MIERLLYSKVYLYQSECKDNLIKWRLSRKIENYDRELEGVCLFYVPFYSPDLSYHIDMDRGEKQF